jgi:cell division protein FtsN
VETKNSAPAPVPQSQSTEAGGYTIQIGSYNVIEQANERVARLQATGFDARVVAVELPKRGTWYRVQAGRFGNREEAARYGNELKSRGAADNFIIAETQGGK